MKSINANDLSKTYPMPKKDEVFYAIKNLNFGVKNYKASSYVSTKG